MSDPAAKVMRSVARLVDTIDEFRYEVHTVLLVLNGQHGGYDLRIEATDKDLTDHAWEATIDRSGSVSHWHKVLDRYAKSQGVRVT